MTDAGKPRKPMPPEVALVLVGLVIATILMGFTISAYFAFWWLGLLVSSFLLHVVAGDLFWRFVEHERLSTVFEIVSGLAKIASIGLLIIGALAIAVTVLEPIFGGHSRTYQDEELPENYRY